MEVGAMQVKISTLNTHVLKSSPHHHEWPKQQLPLVDCSDSTFQKLAHVILTQIWEVKQDYPQSQRLSALLKLLIPKHHLVS